jgi:hypothetical protein
VRKLASPSSDAAMPDIPMQWCFPFRRQHADAAFPVAAKTNGASEPHATTESTKLATNRRMVIRGS